jgi:hypothetical protein
MEIKFLESASAQPALFGIGKSFGVTSGLDYYSDFELSGLSEKMFERAKKLLKLGGGHSQFAKMIFYYYEIEAPLKWWKQYDKYKVGVVDLSESTMHTLMKKELTQDDFEEPVEDGYLEHLNTKIRQYKNCENSRTARYLENALPCGYLQTRVVCYSLLTMLNMYNQRCNHRLPEWKTLCDTFEKVLKPWEG